MSRLGGTTERNIMLSRLLFCRQGGLLRPGSLKGHRYKSGSAVEASHIRNIGVVAHVDAGKTTTTERMLYLAGVTKRMGDVDRGDTVMDYMKQERERGITIQAAAITFDWKDHKVQLIDTPGHADFTIEVERSMRVLDGAVAVFDAVAGVEAQSEVVWRQADRFNVPRLAFVNKMDRQGSDYDRCLEMMRERLGVLTLSTMMPLRSELGEYEGAIDLVGLEVVEGKLSREATDEEWSMAMDHREVLLESAAELDENLMDIWLERNT